RRGGVVPAGPRRSIPPRLSRQPDLPAPGQYHPRERHQHRRGQRSLREWRRGPRGDGGPAGGPGGDAREIAQGQVVGAAPLVAPRRESVLANPEQRSMSGPPARFADRAVMVRTAPPPPPVSFGAKQQALEASQGRPLDAGALDNLRRSAPPANPMVRTMQVAPGSLRQPTPAATPRNTPNDRPP